MTKPRKPLVHLHRFIVLARTTSSRASAEHMLNFALAKRPPDNCEFCVRRKAARK